jgi:hypothetical protein
LGRTTNSKNILNPLYKKKATIYHIYMKTNLINQYIQQKLPALEALLEEIRTAQKLPTGQKTEQLKPLVEELYSQLPTLSTVTTDLDLLKLKTKEKQLSKIMEALTTEATKRAYSQNVSDIDTTELEATYEKKTFYQQKGIKKVKQFIRNDEGEETTDFIEIELPDYEAIEVSLPTQKTNEVIAQLIQTSVSQGVTDMQTRLDELPTNQIAQTPTNPINEIQIAEFMQKLLNSQTGAITFQDATGKSITVDAAGFVDRVSLTNHARSLCNELVSDLYQANGIVTKIQERTVSKTLTDGSITDIKEQVPFLDLNENPKPLGQALFFSQVSKDGVQTNLVQPFKQMLSENLWNKLGEWVKVNKITSFDRKADKTFYQEVFKPEVASICEYYRSSLNSQYDFTPFWGNNEYEENHTYNNPLAEQLDSMSNFNQFGQQPLPQVPLPQIPAPGQQYDGLPIPKELPAPIQPPNPFAGKNFNDIQGDVLSQIF